MTKPLILLDMDGVLADFHQGVADLFNVDLADCKIPKPWNYAVEEQIEWLLRLKDPSDTLRSSTMWQMINEESMYEDFWFHLQPYSWTKELYKMCLDYGSDVIISTSPGYHHKAWGAKIRWLDKHLKHPASKVMMGPQKHLLAAPNRILIDDCEKNYTKFRDAGGKACLFPQPWNPRHTMIEQRLEHVEFILKMWS